jgi:hypothetical protein
MSDRPEDVKIFSIKGAAAEAYTKERKTRKRKQSGGYDVPSPGGEIIPTGANLSRVRNMMGMMKGGASAAPGAAGAGAGAAEPPPPPPLTPPTTPPPNAAQAEMAIAVQKPMLQTGGFSEAKKKKLILEPKKKSMKKLHLAPSTVSGSKIKSKTRKIRVNLTGMKKRLTRAKNIHSDSRNKDIAEIKKTLHEARLLKPKTSTKPDSPEYDLLLRKTYENYMLLRNRAL